MKTTRFRKRRQLLGAASVLPLGTAMFSINSRAIAASESMEATPNAIKHGFSLGEIDVSTLLAGTRTVDNPQSIFGMNVSEEQFAEVSSSNFLPTDKSQFYFTPTVVRAAGEVILFDTGLNPAGILAPLSAAGVAAEDVTIVVITHMHGDHIGGLSGDDGTATFPNARYVTGQTEFDAWARKDNENFDKKVKPLAEKMTFIGDGDSVVSGITSVAAFGHTPGHMCYMLESGNKQLLIAADTANHYVWSLAYPDWEVKFDMDKAAAGTARKEVFGMLEADKVPFIGYHMPFPGMGYVSSRSEGGFEYIPVSYQLTM